MSWWLSLLPDGRLLLGGSSLTSRYWTGDVWLFDKASDAPDVSRFTAAREAESGVPCGMFIDGLGVRAVVCQVSLGREKRGGGGRSREEREWM